MRGEGGLERPLNGNVDKEEEVQPCWHSREKILEAYL